MTTTVTVDAKRIREIFADCIFKVKTDTGECTPAKGILTNVFFHPARLESHKTEIEKMLSDLPHGFKETSNGKLHLLNTSKKRGSNSWTGLQAEVEKLFLLGVGIGKVRCSTRLEFWDEHPHYVLC